MLKKIEWALRRAHFNAGLLGLLTNPGFIARRELYRAVARIAPSVRGDVLDFGCGSKPYGFLFTEAKTYVGMDIEASGHNHKSSEIDIYYQGEMFPLPSERYDWVVSFEVFEHLFNLDRVLEEITRVLKTDGMLLFSAPFVWQEHETPYDFARYTSYGFRHILDRHGFEILSYEKTGNYWLALCQTWTMYIFFYIFRGPTMLRLLLTPFFIAPFHIFAYALNIVLPKADVLFLNSVVVCRKKASSKPDSQSLEPNQSEISTRV